MASPFPSSTSSSCGSQVVIYDFDAPPDTVEPAKARACHLSSTEASRFSSVVSAAWANLTEAEEMLMESRNTGTDPKAEVGASDVFRQFEEAKRHLKVCYDFAHLRDQTCQEDGAAEGINRGVSERSVQAWMSLTSTGSSVTRRSCLKASSSSSPKARQASEKARVAFGDEAGAHFAETMFYFPPAWHEGERSRPRSRDRSTHVSRLCRLITQHGNKKSGNGKPGSPGRKQV
mmetsp:Transcript_55671/g.132742  ORF Transcript_55671/g.132742 Transcript_55671/m.132742 type:complete len:232 (+) Transcript_55671:181-876(+)